MFFSNPGAEMVIFLALTLVLFSLCIPLVWKQLTSSLTKERKIPSCFKEDASYLNKHIDRWRAGSPWELWSPLPPPLCGTGLMGVWGEVGAKRRDRSFHSSFIAWPRYTAKQNSPLMQLSAGSRSPGDHSEQTEVFVTSQLSASEFTLESQALVLWMGPLKQQNILMG